MNPFSEKMASLSDEKLLEVLERRSDYQPQAVEAAEAEWEKRKHDSTYAENIRAGWKQEQETRERKNEVFNQFGRAVNGLIYFFRSGLRISSRQSGEEAVRSAIVYTILFALADLCYSWRWIKTGWAFGEFMQVSFCIIGPCLLGLVVALLIEKRAFGWYLGMWIIPALIAGTAVFRFLVIELLDLDLYEVFRRYDFIYDWSLVATSLLLSGYVFLLFLFTRKKVTTFFTIARPARSYGLSAGIFFLACLTSFGFFKMLEQQPYNERSVPVSSVMAKPTHDLGPEELPANAPIPVDESYRIISKRMDIKTGNEFCTAWARDTGAVELAEIAQEHLDGKTPGSVLMFYSDIDHTPVINEDLSLSPVNDALKYRVAVFKVDSGYRVIRVGKF